MVIEFNEINTKYKIQPFDDMKIGQCFSMARPAFAPILNLMIKVSENSYIYIFNGKIEVVNEKPMFTDRYILYNIKMIDFTIEREY